MYGNFPTKSSMSSSEGDPAAAAAAAEEAAAVVVARPRHAVAVLAATVGAQRQHGLRHGDYQVPLCVSLLFEPSV